jgi:hypothetical protein
MPAAPHHIILSRQRSQKSWPQEITRGTTPRPRWRQCASSEEAVTPRIDTPVGIHAFRAAWLFHRRRGRNLRFIGMAQNSSSWPRSLAGYPFQRPGVGPKVGPTLSSAYHPPRSMICVCFAKPSSLGVTEPFLTQKRPFLTQIRCLKFI